MMLFGITVDGLFVWNFEFGHWEGNTMPCDFYPPFYQSEIRLPKSKMKKRPVTVH
jgi:hypothetical protein